MGQNLVSGASVRPERLPRDLARYGAAIATAVGFSTMQVFIVPRQLDVSTYGQFRLFLLFVNYLGLLQLGVSDGAFLRWAGRGAGHIAWEWRRVLRWVIASQVAVLAAAFVAASFADDVARSFIIATAACALFVNCSALCAYALQAAGDFRRAGRVVGMTPAVFVLMVLAFDPHTLRAILAAYVGAFVVAAAYGVTCVARIPSGPSDRMEALSLRPMMVAGLPVLFASIAAGLSQSVDRFLVSVATPITSFALYGFAGTAAVAANSAVQALSRVTLAHVAHKDVADRARFLGGFLHIIAAGYGAVLVLEPVFEALVARFLPLYVPALPIVRALTLGLPVWVAMRVVIIGTLQSHGHLRRLLAVELVGVALVAALSGTALLAHAALWQVAAAATVAGVATFLIGYLIALAVEGTVRQQPVIPFLAVVVAQGAALMVALAVSNAWGWRSAAYLLLSAAPTGWTLATLRRQRG